MIGRTAVLAVAALLLPRGLAADDGPVVAGAGTGPDVIVGNMPNVAAFGSANGITAFAVATTSCNIGDQVLRWSAGNNQHPVIGQNMYRLNGDRFEQIGMSWLKHGFAALAENLCGQCQDPHNQALLGVGCSDPYSAGLNGVQDLLGPRSPVNADTGFFPYPFTAPPASPTIGRRLQVHNSDLDPASNQGAVYFVEAHYVTADDAAAGNADNNASYRPVTIGGPSGGPYSALVSGVTQRELPAIHAWKMADPSVVLTNVLVPNEGMFIAAAKAVPMDNGFWGYEYAVQNLNSDRSSAIFRVPIPPGAIIDNIGFHDVDYHSGEPFVLTDWVGVDEAGYVTWACEPYSINPNANALRWGTLYNFRFEANVEPAASTVILGLFKPGLPVEIPAVLIGPSFDVIDCNDNTLADACDIACGPPGGRCDLPGCGAALDCNSNAVPDECEADCNNNYVADSCDISSGASADCNTNTVPDDCEPDCDGDTIPDECDRPFDIDGDGILNCLDLCPETTPSGGCICPPIGECCFALGICIPDIPPVTCIEIGGIPECTGSLCRDGCLVADADRDGDRDLADFASLGTCFSGPRARPGFQVPSEECRLLFDWDNDADIDLIDFESFQTSQTGP